MIANNACVCLVGMQSINEMCTKSGTKKNLFRMKQNLYSKFISFFNFFADREDTQILMTYDAICQILRFMLQRYRYVTEKSHVFFCSFKIKC